MGFAADELELGQVFLRVSRFPQSHSTYDLYQC
jgi:hypothetical protein